MNTSIPMPPGSPMRPQKIAAQEIDFREYLSVIMRRRKILILTFLTVFILVALYTFLAKPVYDFFSSRRRHTRF